MIQTDDSPDPSAVAHATRIEWIDPPRDEAEVPLADLFRAAAPMFAIAALAFAAGAGMVWMSGLAG